MSSLPHASAPARASGPSVEPQGHDSPTGAELRLLVVVPTYQEADNIGQLIPLLLAKVPSCDVLVVDDASPDGTADIAKSVGGATGRVHLLQRPAPGGIASAYVDGFRWAFARGYDVLIEMDADLSHSPSDVPRLLAAISDGADLAIGSRYVRGGRTSGWSRRRRALSRCGNLYVQRALRLDVADATAGFRAYRSSLLRQVRLSEIESRGFAFQFELTLRVAELGGVVVEVPIVFTDRRHGRSKISRAIVVEGVVRAARLGVRSRRGAFLEAGSR